MVEKGLLGRKSGAGFYKMEKNAREEVLHPRPGDPRIPRQAEGQVAGDRRGQEHRRPGRAPADPGLRQGQGRPGHLEDAGGQLLLQRHAPGRDLRPGRRDRPGRVLGLQLGAGSVRGLGHPRLPQGHRADARATACRCPPGSTPCTTAAPRPSTATEDGVAASPTAEPGGFAAGARATTRVFDFDVLRTQREARSSATPAPACSTWATACWAWSSTPR